MSSTEDGGGGGEEGGIKIEKQEKNHGIKRGRAGERRGLGGGLRING